MDEHSRTRIQLCGKFCATVAGRRIDGVLPGKQGRLLFAYLVLHRSRPATRDELAAAVWPKGSPASVDSSLTILLSKMRRIAGAGLIDGRSEIRLLLPPNAFVDVEAAIDGVHAAEALLLRGAWLESYAPAHIARYIVSRPLLPGLDAPWLDEKRRDLDHVRVRALEACIRGQIHLAAPELPVAERSARELVRLAPYRESAHRLLMEVLDARGDVAEALVAYEALRTLLRDELGADPGPDLRDYHRHLLDRSAR